MSTANELLQTKDCFNPQEFVNWRSDQVTQLSSLISTLEDNIGSETVLDEFAEQIQLDSQNNILFGSSANFIDVARATTLNIFTTLGHKRNSGRPYASHPEIVGNTILRIATDLSEEDRIQAKILSSMHDVIEEGPLRHLHKQTIPNNPSLNTSYVNSEIDTIYESKHQIDYLFPDNNTGLAVVELMEPIVPDEFMEEYKEQGTDKNIVIYSYFARMLQRSANPAVRNVEISDRIDDICDLDYIFKKDVSDEVKGNMLVGKLARCRHTVDSISIAQPGSNDGISRNLVQAFNMLYGKVLIDNAGIIDVDKLATRISQFDSFFEENHEEMDIVIEQYLQSVT